MSDFYLRNNPDGSSDSICLRCFLTIRPEEGGSLKASEEQHECSQNLAWQHNQDSAIIVSLQEGDAAHDRPRTS
jgi:hypothetical protein